MVQCFGYKVKVRIKSMKVFRVSFNCFKGIARLCFVGVIVLVMSGCREVPVTQSSKERVEIIAAEPNGKN